MATKKCDKDKIKQLISDYNSGVTVANLSVKYGVHEATIRRYLRSNGIELGKLSHTSLMDSRVKLELKKIISKGLSLDETINEIDKMFVVDMRAQEKDTDFTIYHL